MRADTERRRICAQDIPPDLRLKLVLCSAGENDPIRQLLLGQRAPRLLDQARYVYETHCSFGEWTSLMPEMRSDFRSSLLKGFGEKNINITMGYATGGEGSRKTTVVSDLDKASGIR